MIFISFMLCSAASAVGENASGTFADSLYPFPNMTVKESRPVIALDLENIGVSVIPDTVFIKIDGADVTTESDVTKNYIIYRPDGTLSTGKHVISVAADRTDGRRFGPVTWSFTIIGAEPAWKPRRDSTTGSLSVATDYVSADYVPQAGFDVARFFSEREGTKSNTDFSFTNVSEGRVIGASYRRYTQPYTDVSIDRAALTYRDDNFDAKLGSFRIDLSDFTIAGADIEGIKINRNYRSWSLEAFSGRTQDPGIDGDFRQMTYGVRGGYSWNSKNHSSLTLLKAREYDDAHYSTISAPSEDAILSFVHRYDYNEDFSAEVETAMNNRRVDGETDAHHDTAYSLTLNGRVNKVRGSLKAYDVGEFFLPVSDGTSKYLNSNREGIRGEGVYEPVNWARVGGLYEEYYSDTTTAAYIAEDKTKRGNAFVTFSVKDYLPALTYRKTKLVRTSGIVSESDNIHATILLPPIATYFSKTRVTAGWSDIEYTAPGTLLETDVLMFSVYMSFRDSVGVSFSYSKNRNDDTIRLTSTEYKRIGGELRWSLRPGRFTVSGSYYDSDASGQSLDTQKMEYGLGMEYIFDSVYSCSLGWDRIKFSDAISQYYNYKLDILRTGMKMRF